jgi:hypothetical protein
VCDEGFPGDVTAIVGGVGYETTCAEMIFSDVVVATPNNLIGTVSIPANFRLSFDVIPVNVLNGVWGNFVHFTKTGEDNAGGGSRMPAIWFHPGTTKMHVCQDTQTQTNVCINPDEAFPLNALTTLTVESVDLVTTMWFGDQVVGSVTYASARHIGDAAFWFTDKWYASADASIENVQLVELLA